ncbi:MAG: Unknown protein [uncultured Sulfurovum sp.]|uniref:Uncharacterized protein n=1 Tax=uncultured Sulfurovum sp. TaxID=269237 RepID=A0A6S6U1L6_9BACT|nr:MAG: Unknown protein [uncultured Sulfurovum sp.]
MLLNLGIHHYDALSVKDIYKIALKVEGLG